MASKRLQRLGEGEGRHMCAGLGAGGVGIRDPGCPGHRGTRGGREHWAQLFRRVPPQSGLCGTATASANFRLARTCEHLGANSNRNAGRKGEKERSGFKMLSALNINGNVFLKPSVFWGGLSPGPLPCPPLPSEWFCLFALDTRTLEALFLLGDWVITFLIWKYCLFLMLVLFYRLSQAGQVVWFPKPYPPTHNFFNIFPNT